MKVKRWLKSQTKTKKEKPTKKDFRNRLNN